MTNVPTGVWIDEKGFIVRPNEVAYSQNVDFVNGTIVVNGEDYVAALSDWVEHGAESRYVMTKEEIVSKLSVPENEDALADASFRLGVYLYQQGDIEGANRFWDEAQALRPESWNYHRQDWSFLEREEASKNWRRKFDALEGQPYYDPLNLDAGPR